MSRAELDELISAVQISNIEKDVFELDDSKGRQLEPKVDHVEQIASSPARPKRSRVDYRAYLSAIGLAYGATEDEKLANVFAVFDVDGNTTLDLAEFTTLATCIPSTQVDDIDYLAYELFQGAKPSADGTLSLEQFVSTIKTVPQFMRYFSSLGPLH